MKVYFEISLSQMPVGSGILLWVLACRTIEKTIGSFFVNSQMLSSFLFAITLDANYPQPYDITTIFPQQVLNR